jgi:hypothetical protein
LARPRRPRVLPRRDAAAPGFFANLLALPSPPPLGVATAPAGCCLLRLYVCTLLWLINILMFPDGVITQRCYYMKSNAWGAQLVVPFALDWEVFGSRVNYLFDHPKRLWCNYSLKMKPKGGLRKVKSIFFNTLTKRKFASNLRAGFTLQHPRRVISLSQAVRPIGLSTAFRSQSD